MDTKQQGDACHDIKREKIMAALKAQEPFAYHDSCDEKAKIEKVSSRERDGFARDFSREFPKGND